MSNPRTHASTGPAGDPDPLLAVLTRIAGQLDAIGETLRGRIDPPPLLLTSREAAALVGVHDNTFRRLVHRAMMPKPVSLGPGANPKWRRKDLEAAVEQLRVKRR